MKKFFYLFLPIILGGITGLLINNFMNYNSLIKPFLSPPGYIFPIAWSIIYLLIGISYYLYRKNNNDIKNISILKKFPLI